MDNQIKQIQNKRIDFNYDKFISIGEKFNIIVEITHFKKLKDYTEFIKYMINIIETTINLKKIHCNNNTIDVDMDLINYKIKEFDFDFIKMMITFFQEKYPDNLNRIHIRNANLIVKGIYKLLKPFICKETREKIYFEHKNKKLTNDIEF
jgi:hypothetical protein